MKKQLGFLSKFFFKMEKKSYWGGIVKQALSTVEGHIDKVIVDLKEQQQNFQKSSSQAGI